MGPLTLQLGMRECPLSDLLSIMPVQNQGYGIFVQSPFPVLLMSQTTFFFIRHPVNIQTLCFQKAALVTNNNISQRKPNAGGYKRCIGTGI